jgi:hypothetical protein
MSWWLGSGIISDLTTRLPLLLLFGPEGYLFICKLEMSMPPPTLAWANTDSQPSTSICCLMAYCAVTSAMLRIFKFFLVLSMRPRICALF